MTVDIKKHEMLAQVIENRMTIALKNPRHNRMGFPQEMGTQHDK